jgi:hypothetical protein
VAFYRLHLAQHARGLETSGTVGGETRVGSGLVSDRQRYDNAWKIPGEVHWCGIQVDTLIHRACKHSAGQRPEALGRWFVAVRWIWVVADKHFELTSISCPPAWSAIRDPSQVHGSELAFRGDHTPLLELRETLLADDTPRANGPGHQWSCFPEGPSLMGRAIR